MAAIYQEKSENGNNGDEISRQDIQAAFAKAVELRALHAALVQGNSPANLRLPSSSPVSRHAPHFSAQDYPVFTPVSIAFTFSSPPFSTVSQSLISECMCELSESFFALLLPLLGLW